MSRHRKKHNKLLHGMGGGLFMIGLGLIFLLDIPFWPWILLLIGISGTPSSIAEEGLGAGLQTFVWMAGLAIMFATGQWALILILIGLSTILGAMVRPDSLSKSKHKHGEDNLPMNGPHFRGDDDPYAADETPRRDRATR